jgi:hypothetical protein
LGLVRRKETNRLAVEFPNGPKFGYVDSPFAGFALIHEGVSHPQADGNLPLGEAGFLPGRD